MNKVMLSVEEATALKSALEINGGVKSNVVAWHAVNGLWEGSRQALNELDLETINLALYVGYEVEAGPEEEILNHYMNGSTVFKSGIKFALDKLNVQIKGINC